MINKFIYFPSLSNGASKEWLWRDTKITPDLMSRFYDKSLPEKWRFPYFLLSAGHNYKHENLRKDMGLEDSYVIGDSGGYQIATGALQWDVKLRETLFNWLERNSDIALNLDIPPREAWSTRFNEALEISVDNFKWFEQHQTGKVKYLNILQGDNPQRQATWYKEVRGLEFSGWSIGGTFGVGTELLHGLALLLENKEFDKVQNQYLHILGVSGIRDFMALATIQKCMNDRYGDRVIVSTDSSSPTRATLYGTYYFDVNWKTASWQSFHFEKYMPDINADDEMNEEEYNYWSQETYDIDAPLPCRINCPVCEGLTYGSIAPYDHYAYMVMTNHNLYLYLNVIDTIHKLINSGDDHVREIFGRENYKLY